MIFCCGRYNVDTNISELSSNDIYKNRKLETYTCPICNKLKAILKQERISDGKIIELRPKKGQVKKFIEKYSSEFRKSVKQGLKANADWLYFNGEKDNWVRDFNGVKKFKIVSELKVLNSKVSD